MTWLVGYVVVGLLWMFAVAYHEVVLDDVDPFIGASFGFFCGATWPMTVPLAGVAILVGWMADR